MSITTTTPLPPEAQRDLLPMLETLEELRNVMKAKRHRRGSIDFDIPEVKVKLDDSVLKDVASQTRGEFFLAESAADLNRISSSLGTRFVLERKETEISSWFTAAGALLLLIACVLSLRRSNRIL